MIMTTMKYDLMLRSRANPDEPYESKHERFFGRLRAMPQPWGLEGQEPPACPEMGRYELRGARFGKLLGKGIRAQAIYLYRHPALAEDIGMNDDFVDMSFNPKKVDYQSLIRNALPAYIEAFDGHMAEIKDQGFTEIDFDAWRASGKDGRNGVYRIAPVSFFDRLLCQRAFNLTPERIAARLSGKVEEVRLIHDGVYIIGSSQPLDLETADKLSWDMKRWIIEDK